MGLTYENLDDLTRASMITELERDIAAGTLYVSPRLTDAGAREWPALLLNAIRSESDGWLERQLADRGLLKTHEAANRKGTVYMKAVPVNAGAVLSEGEFNRFYLRGIGARGDKENRMIEIYRGRASANPRPESEALVGQRLNAGALLNDLRTEGRVDNALGLPPGPNSGLTGKLV